MSFVSLYTSNVKRKREELSRLRKDRVKYVNDISSASQKIIRLSNQLKNTKSSSMIKSKMNEISREEKKKSDAEKKVADYVLANEIECSKISLEKLAKRSGVSQPTVMRFVKAMGFDGFKEFRYQIIEDLSERNHREKETYAMYGYPIRPEDDLKLIPAKDLMTKLLYLGYDCRFDEDYYIQHISAALTEKDVMVGISYSGQSKDTVDIMKAAKKAGAQTICITNFRESRIGKWSDVVLCSSQKQWMYGDCIFSRSPQIVINDMIYMGLMTNAYEKGTKQLDKNSRIIRDRAYEQ